MPLSLRLVISLKINKSNHNLGIKCRLTLALSFMNHNGNSKKKKTDPSASKT